MVAKKPGKPEIANDPAGADAVDAFLRQFDHPLKPEIEAVRRIILGASPGIGEGIKWNAPSFHFKEYFATVGVRAQDCVHVVFHRGAKVKDNATRGMQIDDPEGLLEWHANERCSARFHDMKEVESKAAALKDLVRQWIRQM
ncbi:MAG: DUF1801 domain-containing protein [Planctomycetota bacterium]